MEINKEITCKNCKYFIRHYVKYGTHFTVANCGHCINDRLYGKRTKNKNNANNDCTFWEAADDKKQLKQSVKSVLEKMEEHLSEICDMLKDDG